MDVTDSSVYQMMSELVGRGVTITSTLAVIESYTAGDAVFDARCARSRSPCSIHQRSPSSTRHASSGTVINRRNVDAGDAEEGGKTRVSQL